MASAAKYSTSRRSTSLDLLGTPEATEHADSAVDVCLEARRNAYVYAACYVEPPKEACQIVNSKRTE